MNFNASLNLMSNIGELCSKISQELKFKYPDIEWKKVKDFRNRIVHDYAGLNIYIVFKIIKTELPVLRDKVEQIIKKELLQDTFDSEEMNVAQNSSFYSFIDFSKLL